jgi:hypothetical protein
MANPRKKILHEGVNQLFETFLIDNSTITYDSTKDGGSSQVGLAVSFSANDTVKLSEDGNFVLGKLVAVESDGTCTVQTKGGCTLPAGNAATVTAGSTIVGALGAASAKGYVRNTASGTAAELVAQNGRIYDASTTTALDIML